MQTELVFMNKTSALEFFLYFIWNVFAGQTVHYHNYFYKVIEMQTVNIFLLFFKNSQENQWQQTIANWTESASEQRCNAKRGSDFRLN